MTQKTPSWWDPYSNQPYRLPAALKSRDGVATAREYAVTLATALGLLPAIGWRYWQQPDLARGKDIASFAGIGVSLEAGHRSAQQDLVAELGVRQLMLRVPLWNLDAIDEYAAFARGFDNCDVVVNILQDRQSVLDPQRWQHGMQTIVETFLPTTTWFQIGNAINRTKWGCMHAGDYLTLADATRRLRAAYPTIKLAGSSVIDFEPLVTLRTLVNGYDHRFEACASQLYVNRRGSPIERQYGVFDLHNKIRTIAGMLSLSNCCERRLWLSEINWPLLNTKPYTPNSGHTRSTVDETTQARYLTDYYRIAWHTRQVERVYWWQLLSPGYGLVDTRNGELRKMASFYAMRRVMEEGVDGG